MAKSLLESASVGEPTIMSGCETEVIPSPGCSEDPNPCFEEQLAFYASVAALVAAESAYIAALVSCAASGGVLCPSVIAAVAGVTATSLGVAATKVALDECRTDTGGGGDGSQQQDCETIVLEISNDGGVTWEYLGTVEVCE